MSNAYAMSNTDPSNNAAWQRLKEIINEKSYITDGDFTLASGESSNFFFDMKITMLDPEGAMLTAELILDMIAEDEATAIGGMELGACPIVSAVCVQSQARGKPINAFYVRKTPKKRGTQKMVEGAELKSGDKVIMVEDVTTSGGSVMKAIEEVRALGCEVVKVITIVDRQQGAKDYLQQRGAPLYALFTKEDFVVPL